MKHTALHFNNHSQSKPDLIQASRGTQCPYVEAAKTNALSAENSWNGFTKVSNSFKNFNYLPYARTRSQLPP